MKHIVTFDEYNEIDLKPSDLLQTYMQMTEQDVRGRLLSLPLHECDCPGCHGSTISETFLKFGMRYAECGQCGSLYVTPRPAEEALTDYYRNSPSRTYWRETISKQSGQKRKEKIIKPRLDWIVDSTRDYMVDAQHIIDINTDQYGYIEEMLETSFFQRKTLLNPYWPLTGHEYDGRIDIVTVDGEVFPVGVEADVITLFEVPDRKAQPDRLLEGVRKMLRTKGLCFITGILASGLDIQILWEKAENIFPPDRINIFTVEGVRHLVERHGFECLEISTPGILDVEMVEKTVQQNPDVTLPRFFRYFLQNRGNEGKKSFQEFLQMNLLSSYGRILLRKQ